MGTAPLGNRDDSPQTKTFTGPTRWFRRFYAPLVLGWHGSLYID